MDENAERLEKKLDEILTILHGNNEGSMGMVHKVTILWRLIVIWPMCSASAVAGAIFTLILERLFK